MPNAPTPMEVQYEFDHGYSQLLDQAQLSFRFNDDSGYNLNEEVVESDVNGMILLELSEDDIASHLQYMVADSGNYVDAGIPAGIGGFALHAGSNVDSGMSAGTGGFTTQAGRYVDTGIAAGTGAAAVENSQNLDVTLDEAGIQGVNTDILKFSNNEF